MNFDDLSRICGIRSVVRVCTGGCLVTGLGRAPQGVSFFFSLSNKFILFYLFIFGCVGSSLLLTGLLYLRRAGATLRCSARASHCGGFSHCGAWALGARASVVVACGLSSCGSQALERRLSSCGARV